jgi:Ca2+-binding RTX toxin-like protein
VAITLNISGEVDGTFTLEDDGTAGNNTSVLRRPDGTIFATFVHPADAFTVVSRAGQSIVINITDSLTTGNFTIGSLTVPASNPDNISVGAMLTSGIVTLAARNAINELGSDSASDIIAGRLFLDAGSGIGVGNAIETQVGVLEADTTSGGINLANIGNLTLGGAALGTANLRGLFAGSGNVTLVNQGSITLSDTDGVESVHSGGSLTLSAIGASADIISTVNHDALFAGGNLFANSGRDILFGTGGANFDNDVRAGGGIFMNVARDFRIDGFSDMAADDQGQATGGGITIAAGRDILIEDDFGTNASVGVSGSGGGAVLLTTGVGGTLSLAANTTAAIFAGAGGVIVRADRMLIENDSGINVASNGVATLTTVSAGRGINFGSSVDGVTELEISDAELDRIFASNVVIGSDTTGRFQVVNAITTTNNNLTLRTGGDLIIQANITTPQTLTLHAGEDLSQTGASTMTTGTFTATVDSPDTDAAGGVVQIAGNLNFTSASLRGNADNDRVTGNAIGNIIFGFAGNDTLDGAGGNDVMNGGLGNDVFVVDAAGDFVSEAVGEGNDRVLSAVTYTLPVAAEVEELFAQNQAGQTAINLTGNGFNQIIIGNDGVNSLAGLAGNDTLFGNGDNDNLDGGLGDDVTVGGLGNDTHFVDSLNDAVLESVGQGTDQVIASVTYRLGASAEIEVLQTSNAAGTAAIDIAANDFNQSVFGNEGNNILEGLGGTDTLTGGGGNDTLSGGTGTDTTIGGLGDDIHIVDAAADIVNELAGAGNDRVLASASYTLAAGVSVELLSALNQNASDPLTLIGNEIANNIQANEGDNTLVGGAGNDTLFGLGGIDALNGGLDTDTLIGGTGGDSYVFSTTLSASNIDIVIGFATGSDHILLDDAVFTALPTGALAAGAFRTGTAAGDGDDRIIYDPATGALFYDPDGTGATAQIQFAVLQGAPALAVTDFVVI